MQTITLKGYGTDIPPYEAIELGTYDSYGVEQLQIVKAPDWENLSVIATFNPPNKKPVQVVVDSVTGVIKVPKEATADLYGVGTIVFVGLADGVQRISADVEYIVRKHSNASGTEPAEPTPSVVEQILTEAQNANVNSTEAKKLAISAKDIAQSVRTDADNGKFNGKDGKDGAKGDKGDTGPQGPQGVPGADGHTPEYGVDYGTPEQIQGIAQYAAEILQPDVNQIKDDLSALAPAGAQVGQIFRVAAVSEDEKYTMEPVDMPSGDGMRTIADITLEENVAQCIFSADADGNSLDLREVIIYGNLIKTVTNCYTKLKISDGINEHTLTLGRYNGSESVIWHVILADDGSLFYTIQNSENRFYYSIYKSALSCITNITVFVNGSTNAVMETGSRIAIIGR